MPRNRAAPRSLSVNWTRNPPQTMQERRCSRVICNVATIARRNLTVRRKGFTYGGGARDKSCAENGFTPWP